MAETDVVVVLASTLSCHIGRHSPDNSRTGLNNSIFCIPWGCDGQSDSSSVSAESVQINTDRRLSATAKDVRSGPTADIGLRQELPQTAFLCPYYVDCKECTIAHGSSICLSESLPKKRRRTDIAASSNWQPWCRRQAQSQIRGPRNSPFDGEARSFCHQACTLDWEEDHEST